MKNIFNTLDKKDKVILLSEVWLFITMCFIWSILVINNIKPTEFSNNECFWYTHWHIYCPGCGGTRAFESLLYGNIIKSIIYHPFVMYVFTIFIISIISYIIYFITKGNKFIFKLNIKHFIYADLIFVIYFLFRNLLVLYFDIYLY